MSGGTRMYRACGRVRTVLPDSVAGRAGLQPGDCLFAINGEELRDVIDVRFYAAEEELELAFLRNGETHTVRATRAYDESLGLEFEELLFDGIRTCRDRCEFCFVAQMPKGLRRSLYVRDDDYRLSFLNGSFVTLTNLTEEDWQRIERQHLSPLYISVHATRPGVRSQVLGMANIPDIRLQIERLASMGIEMHCQVVLMPGVNDGAVLEQTIAELASFYPSVASLSLVPVGLTRFHRGRLKAYAAEEATALLEQADAWRGKFAKAQGVRFVHPSDEFYLLAGREVPPASEYDGFPQVENGVGLVRLFLEDWRKVKVALHARGCACDWERMTWVTGTLFAPLLARVAGELQGPLDITIDIAPVANRFFGETVTVAGLLTAQGVVDALQGREVGEVVCLPKAMLDSEGRRTLDDRSPEWMEAQVGAPLVFVKQVGDILGGVLGVL